ncbi:hypothetical protein [Martelella mediterranea]|uniref:YrhK-like protein n=1 Tax=Martelella mediterranea TaxID=293089 RepID=A0A4R3NVM0_9HYPH|nr:hypothetical protein [Martelella mediterranea]TCT40915.1 hypothetical protein EDC90_100855 [Martelella mediterranea]
MKQQVQGEGAAHGDEKGPLGFITFRSYHHQGHHIIWRARDHRKGLRPRDRLIAADETPIWQSYGYNWVMGLIFATGSFLFMLGSVMALMPEHIMKISALTANITFFAGSIPFTTAGFLQNFQAANAKVFSLEDASSGARIRPALLGWQPGSLGWLSAITQFVGTIAFNFNTFDAIKAPAGWVAQDVVIWLPGMIGSVLFLVSAYFAVMETCHAHFAFKPKEIAWWIVMVNFVGCIFFMVASTLAYVPHGQEADWIVPLSNANLWAGAFCFFVAAVLSMREARLAMSE